MHISITRPSDAKLKQLIEKYSRVAVTQPDSGTTRNWEDDLPRTHTEQIEVRRGKDLVLHKRDRIGAGEDQFEATVAALKLGKCFDLKWVTPILARPAESGDTFSLLVRSFGLWSANFCRIIYLESQDDYAGRQFVMGVGTLPRHAAIGEERLTIKWVRETDEVWFLIDSYSQPNSLLSRLFAPYLRQQQFLFLEQAPQRLARVSDETPPRIPSLA